MPSGILRHGTCWRRNKSCRHLPAEKWKQNLVGMWLPAENQEGDQNYDKLYIYR